MKRKEAFMNTSCTHSPTGYANIEVPQRSGASIIIPVKLCDRCLLATPLNASAQEGFDELTKEQINFARGVLQERHTGFDFP